MALSYCEVCGVLIPGGKGQSLPEGVICDECFGSRQVVMPGAEDSDESTLEAELVAAKVQFECVYCRAVLRVEAVMERTRLRCPKCSEIMFLNADGRVEARLEGGTTAIIAQQRPLEPLTPAEGLGANKPEKTQPLPRYEGKPAARESDESDALDLLPETIGPGEATLALGSKKGAGKGKGKGKKRALRLSDEGRLNLDTEALRSKTTRLGESSRKKAKRKGTGKTARPSKRAGKAAPPPEKKRERRKAREERVRRAEEATRKAVEQETQRERQNVRALFVWAVLVIPWVLTALLLSMTVRRVGFASRGAVGERLELLGGSMDRGTRALNGLLPPAVQVPGLDRERPQ